MRKAQFDSFTACYMPDVSPTKQPAAIPTVWVVPVVRLNANVLSTFSKDKAQLCAIQQKFCRVNVGMVEVFPKEHELPGISSIPPRG